MARPLVKLDNVDVALDGRTILRSVSWRLLPGESWAILGGNGSGKSTLLRLIRGELWPVPGRGRRVYALDGKEQATAVDVKEAMPVVSPELQQRYLRQEWRLTAQQVIESGFGGGDYVYASLTERQKLAAARVARRLGADHVLRRNVQELSTGELRRVLIARALVSRPRVLVCDELCDGLDATARSALLATLDAIARNGTQLLFTTHRREELVPAITHRIILEQGRIVECGRIRSSRRSAIQPRTMALIKAEGPATDRSRVRSASSPILIRVTDASVFLGSREVLRDIHWQMRTGEHWAVLGENGAGKTTFLKLVLGDVQPALGGRVQRFEFTKRNTIWEIKRRIGWVSPDLQVAYRDSARGADVIASGFDSSIGAHRRLSVAQRRSIATVARELGVTDLLKRDAQQLSFGEFRKLLLARALVHEPRLLVCDEPYDGLDEASRAAMSALLARVAANGTSLLVVTHHPEGLPACTTHVARLAAGRIEFQGPLGEFAPLSLAGSR